MLDIHPTLLGMAIHAMDEGVAIFDSKGLLVACNTRYVLVQKSLGSNVWLGMPSGDLISAGLPQRKLPEARKQGNSWLDQHCQTRGACSTIRRTRDGRVYKVNERPISEGGFVAVWTDVTELLGEQADSAPATDCGAKLTDRQREVLQLLVHGYSMKEVGRILGIAPRTVAFHKYQAMGANQLSSNADLLQFAIEQNLLPRAARSHPGE